MEFWPSDAPDGGLASLVRMIIGHRVEVIEITSVLSCCSDSGPQLQRRKLQHPSSIEGRSAYRLRLYKTSSANQLQSSDRQNTVICEFALQSANIVGFCLRVQRTCSCCALFHGLPRQFVADTDEGGRMEWAIHLDGVFGSTTISTRDNVAVILNANFPPFMDPSTNAEASCIAILGTVDSVLDESAASSLLCQAGYLIDLQLLLPNTSSRRSKAKQLGPSLVPISHDATLLRKLGMVFGPLTLSPGHIRNVVIVLNVLSSQMTLTSTVPQFPPAIEFNGSPDLKTLRAAFEASFRGLVDRANATLAQAVCDNMDTFSRAARSSTCDAQRAVLCRSIAESITSMVLRSTNQEFITSVCASVGIATPNPSQLLCALEEQFMDSTLK